jgi:hypothetical protein
MKESIKSDIQKINELYDFIKSSSSDYSMVELIIDFCEKYDYSLEDIGYIISDDKYLKEFIENDCKKFKFSKDLKVSKFEEF